MMMRPGTWAGIRNRTRPGGRRRSGSPPSTRSRPGGFARASSGSASAARRSNGRWRPTAWGPTGGESSGSRRKGRFSVGFHERKRPCRTPPTRTRADAARGRDALRVSGNASRVASRGERVESAPRPRRKRGAMWRCGDVETTPRRGICRDRKVVHAPTTRIRSSGCRVPVFPARVPGRGPPSACVGALGSRAGARRRRRSRSPRTVRLPIPS